MNRRGHRGKVDANQAALLVLGEVADAHPTPVGTIFPVAGIVRATSGRPDADTITITVLGSQEQIDCAVFAVADATTVQLASRTHREALRATLRPVAEADAGARR